MKLSSKQIELGALYLFFTMLAVVMIGLTDNKLLLIISGTAFGCLLMLGTLSIMSAFEEE